MTEDWQSPRNLVERAEMLAFEDAYRAASPDFAAATGMRHEWVGEALVLSLPVSEARVFNRVLGFGVSHPVTEELVDRALTHFADWGAFQGAVQVSPLAKPEEFAEWLYARGMRPVESGVKMFRDDAPVQLVETDLFVTEIGHGQAGHFAEVVSEGFDSPEWMGYWLANLVGRPNWHIYVAYDGMTPAATGALYCRDGFGWLGFGATRPAFRRRRAQGALLSARLQHGLALGCTRFSTDTWEPEPDESNPSLNNMVRSGFQLAHNWVNFALFE